MTNENQSEKYHQLGASAWAEVLKAVVGSKGADVHQAVLVVDLHSRTCDVMRAFLQVSNSWSMPAYYWGLTDTARNDGLNEADWARYHMVQWMANESMLGNLSIQGVPLPPELQV